MPQFPVGVTTETKVPPVTVNGIDVGGSKKLMKTVIPSGTAITVANGQAFVDAKMALSNLGQYQDCVLDTIRRIALPTAEANDEVYGIGVAVRATFINSATLAVVYDRVYAPNQSFMDGNQWLDPSVAGSANLIVQAYTNAALAMLGANWLYDGSVLEGTEAPRTIPTAVEPTGDAGDPV